MAWYNNLFQQKSVPTIGIVEEVTRDGIHKTYIPQFMFKPPFGYPRNQDLVLIRRLAKTPYVDMVITTILEEVAAVDWEILPAEGYVIEGDEEAAHDNKGSVSQEAIDHVRDFLNNPNTNHETFEEVFIRRALRDVLEVDSGILNKVYNLKDEMVEIVARDGASFTKNPDIHGMFTDRVDILHPNVIVQNDMVLNPFQEMTEVNARMDAAYFQYGFFTGPAPIPFGRKEIMWLEKHPRTYEIYGVSPVMILADILKALNYYIEGDLEYFNKNNVPKGLMYLEGADDDTLEMFKEGWTDQLYVKDNFGGMKRNIHKVPISNVKAGFERIEFSSEELEVLEKQKWYSKVVWSCFGVTPTEMGFTEDAKGMSNQIVQSKVVRKKAILPLLRILENKINREIIPEFEYENIRFKFDMFDIDEEKSRAELYKEQVTNGLRSVNEIRAEQGLEPIDWGDEPPKNWNGGDMNFGFNNENSANPQGERRASGQENEESNPKNKEKVEDKGGDIFDKTFALIEKEIKTANQEILNKANSGKLK